MSGTDMDAETDAVAGDDDPDTVGNNSAGDATASDFDNDGANDTNDTGESLPLFNIVFIVVNRTRLSAIIACNSLA
jgi:hypothetical protein